MSKITQKVRVGGTFLTQTTSTSYVQSGSERTTIDTSKYDGTVSYFFEAIIWTNSGAETGSAELYDDTAGAAVSSSQVSTTSTTPVRARSSSLTLTSGNRFSNRVKITTGTPFQVLVQGAWVIIQQEGSWTKTQAIIPHYTGQFAEPSAPTEWKMYYPHKIYVDDAVDGTLTGTFETSLSNLGYGSIAYARLQNITDGVTMGTVSTTSSSLVYVPSSSFTVTPGKEYEIQHQSEDIGFPNGIEVGVSNIYIEQTGNFTTVFMPASLNDYNTGNSSGADNTTYPDSANKAQVGYDPADYSGLTLEHWFHSWVRPAGYLLVDQEGFETDLGDWVNDATHAQDWVRNSGGTTSSGTGPSSAAVGTWYIYVETSSGGAFTAGDESIIEYDLGGVKEGAVRFRVHQYGTDQGTLYLEGWDGATWTTIWSQTGDQGDQWIYVFDFNETYFNGYSKLRFRNVAAGGFRGDVALDNVIVYVNNQVTSYERLQDVTNSTQLAEVSDNEAFFDLNALHVRKSETFTAPASGAVLRPERRTSDASVRYDAISSFVTVLGILASSANDERGSEVSGEAIGTTERDAEISGQDAMTGERAAEVGGAFGSDGERLAEVGGQSSFTGERSAEVEGALGPVLTAVQEGNEGRLTWTYSI